MYTIAIIPSTNPDDTLQHAEKLYCVLEKRYPGDMMIRELLETVLTMYSYLMEPGDEKTF